MANPDRMRDFLTAPPPPEYFSNRAAEGWRLVAVEWERGIAPRDAPGEDIPFGLRVAADCRRLEDHPEEIQVLLVMMEVIAQDGPLSQAAQALNERGYRTREGAKWTLPAVFQLLPRLIEMGPRLSKSEEWIERRRQVLRVA